MTLTEILSSMKAKSSFGLGTHISDMKITFQITSNRYTEALDVFNISRTVPSRVYKAWILLWFFVNCIMLHLTG